MEISYFTRNAKAGISIGKVSKSYIDEMKSDFDVKEFFLPCANASPISIFRNMLFVYKNRNINGINHITGDAHYLSFVLPKSRTITTVHDIGFWESGFNKLKGIRKILLKILFLDSLKYNKKIVCISKYTKNSILKNTNIESNRINVIFNPINPAYAYHYRKFNADSPVILHIGTRDNKNLERVIESLSGISCILRIVGYLSDYQTELLNEYKVNYINVKDLSEQQILQEYINCDIVSFPSLYEGFGMPIVEGQAVGRVVLTSNIEPLIEVSGGTALCVDPFDVESIRNGFKSLINDSILRNSLIEKGLDNVLRFSSQKIAHDYAMLYSKLLKNNKYDK